MKSDLHIESIENWLGIKSRPLVIAGPCSAESETQVLSTAQKIAASGKASVLRAGVWKPRTRPGDFEGAGVVALQWLKEAKAQTGLPVAVEVANAVHVEEALKHGIDILWIGARTTVNPFSVQEIADALRGVDIPVLVKNPVNPDLQLWVGALERVNRAGIRKLAAVHRGFSSLQKVTFRNEPMWEIPIALKTLYPDLPVFCDPSHICGNTELLSYVSQKAIDLDMQGLMIEVHFNPKVAWTDAKQQISPVQLASLIDGLTLRKAISENPVFDNKLEELRKFIDDLDDEIIEKMAERMNIAEKIGEYKRDNNVTILQVRRWEEIIENRSRFAEALKLSHEFTEKLLELIHAESIRRQTEVMNSNLEQA